MPYVVLAPASRAARSATAEIRWKTLLAEKPELQPAVALQRALLGLVAELGETLASGGVAKLSLPPKYLAAKLLRGVPVLAGEPIPVPVAVLGPAMVRLCNVLARSGAGETAGPIRTQLVETRLNAASLLTAALTRDQPAVRATADGHGLSHDLLWLVVDLAISPFANALRETLFTAAEAHSPLGVALAAWDLGYCPFCASWPTLAETDGADGGAARVLRCSCCSAAWTLTRRTCIYCRTDGEKFVSHAPLEGREGRRLELCNGCRAYFKTIEVACLSPFPLLAIGDLDTMDLDLAAMKRGYGRPTPKNFAKR